MIKTCVIGRLTKDPELRYTPSGKAVVNITVAADVGFGEKKHTEFTDWQAWEKLAETLNKFLCKGSQIYFEGNPKTDKYQDKEGNTRYKTRYNVKEFAFLGGNKKADSGNSEYVAGDSDFPPFEDDENVPF